MDFHVLTLFPDMVRQGLNTSIIGSDERRTYHIKYSQYP